MTPEARTVLAAMANHRDAEHVATDLAYTLDMRRESVYRALVELEAGGFVRVSRRRVDATGCYWEAM